MSDVTPAPRAFLSHASEDKADYAAPLGRELLARGVNAWLDRWEIKAGDSLVTKIFEEGLKDAAAVVIILSKHSVNKPWVQKELNVGVVKSIDKASRLIPVKVDDCEVPESLRDLVWIEWSRLGSAEKVAEEIAGILHGVDRKPTLGAAPKYLQSTDIEIPGLTHQDVVVLDLLYRGALEHHREFVQTAEILPYAEQVNLPLDLLLESVEVLTEKGYVWDKGSMLHHNMFIVEFPSALVLSFAEAKGVDVDSHRRRIAALILNEDVADVATLAQRTGIQEALVESVVDDFEQRGLLKTIRTIGGGVHVHSPTVQFRRWLRDG